MREQKEPIWSHHSSPEFSYLRSADEFRSEVVAPISVQILYRGLYLRGLMACTGFLPAALLSSVVFGWHHVSLTSGAQVS